MATQHAYLHFGLNVPEKIMVPQAVNLFESVEDNV
jgi:hypothetical protein